MSEAMTEQAAVDATKAPAVPGATAGQDARNDGNDLDTLLAEYDQQVRPAPTPQTQPEQKSGTDAVAKPAADPDVAEVKRYIFKQDMDKTVKSIRGELPSDYFDDSLVKAWIEAQAEEDPRLGLAWANRHSNPKQFEKVVDTLGRKFSKQYGKLPDKQATDDREAVSAAVRGASHRAPEGKAPDFSGMNNAEFREEHKKLYGYYPPV